MDFSTPISCFLFQLVGSTVAALVFLSTDFGMYSSVLFQLLYVSLSFKSFAFDRTGGLFLGDVPLCCLSTLLLLIGGLFLLGERPSRNT